MEMNLNDARKMLNGYQTALKTYIQSRERSFSREEKTCAHQVLGRVHAIEFSVDSSDNKEGYVDTIKALLGQVDHDLNDTLGNKNSELRDFCQIAKIQLLENIKNEINLKNDNEQTKPSFRP